MREGTMEDLVRIKAFELWEAEGHPVGREEDHWFRAQELVVAPADAASVVETASAPKAVRLHGSVDSAGLLRLHGWVLDEERPAEPVTVILFDNEVEVARVTASIHRVDLEKGGIGTGCSGYNFIFPQGFWRPGPHSLRLASSDGHPIPDPRSRLATFVADLLALT
jgi:hypothetical protein